MEDINKVKSISLWIFIVPFVAVNTCLILITQFHSLFPNQENVILNTIPYIDGGTSISRTARVFPTYWIFKPAMFLTSYLLIKYWIWNKNIINYFHSEAKHINKIIFFWSRLGCIVNNSFNFFRSEIRLRSLQTI